MEMAIKVIGSIINHYPNKIELTIVKDEEIIRKIEIVEGNEYLVNPVNPRKLKHRGRKVIFKYAESDRGHVTANVQFLDTKRIGKVDIDDLDSKISEILN